MKSVSFLIASALLMAGGFAEAQNPRTKASTVAACCAITAIDAATAMVTAQDKAGKTFQFKVGNAALLRTLRVGQSVFADFMTASVSIKYGEPCCNILKATGAGGAAGAADGNASSVGAAATSGNSSITAIDVATRIVTAKENATGRAFRFEVRDAALLKSLKLGQKISADFGSSKVRIHGVGTCCSIIGHGMN